MLNIPHPFRNNLSGPLRRLLIHDLMQHGHATEAEATAAVEKFEGDHPILDRLAAFDWAAILKLVLAILPLFLAKPPQPTGDAVLDVNGLHV
jgi:hypothetical protein